MSNFCRLRRWPVLFFQPMRLPSFCLTALQISLLLLLSAVIMSTVPYTKRSIVAVYAPNMSFARWLYV